MEIKEMTIQVNDFVEAVVEAERVKFWQEGTGTIEISINQLEELLTIIKRNEIL